MNDVKRRLDHAYSLAQSEESYDQALEICNVIVAEGNFLEDVLNTRARIHELKGELIGAVEDISSVIEINSNEPDYYFNRGRWYAGLGKFAEAVDDESRALELGKSSDFHYYDDSAYFFRAVGLLGLGKFQEALSDLEHVEDDFIVYSSGLGRLTKESVAREARKLRERNQ